MGVTQRESEVRRMADENVNQENGDNLEASQADQQAAGDTSGVSDEQQRQSSSSDAQKSPEEIAWDDLSGPAQERFKRIIQEKNALEQKLGSQVQQDSQWAQRQYPDQTQEPGDEFNRAVKALREKAKFATQDDLYALVGQIQEDREHERLSDKYDGSNGLPKYDKTEVRDYMKRKNMYGNPEAAFRDMYFDEFVDNGKKVVRRGGGYVTEKPGAGSAASRNEPMTLEKLKAELDPANPKSRENYAKYMKNPQAFDALVAQLQK